MAVPESEPQPEPATPTPPEQVQEDAIPRAPSWAKLVDRSATPGIAGAVLNLVAWPESAGNYNAWLGNARQNKVDLSTMTLGEIKLLQKRRIKSAGGSAIGRYQIILKTMKVLQERLHVSDAAAFTPAMQDHLALSLLEDAGYYKWLIRRLSTETFLHNMSKIWASLPKDSFNVSYYAGVGNNKALVRWDRCIEFLDSLER